MRFGTDGVRGVANTDLTASFALDLGRAAARVLGGTEAVVGGDTRVSTAMLEAAFVAGLASEGVVVHRLGVVPTPVVAFEAARRDCLGAVISASHNAYRDNGIKLFARGGTKLPDDVEERIEADVAGACPGPAASRPSSSTSRTARPTATTSSAALEGRRLDGLRIVVDAANGAASGVAGPLFAGRRRRRRRHPRRARRAQHQRRLRGDRHGLAGRGRRRARRRPRAGPRRRRRPAAGRRPHRGARRRRPPDRHLRARHARPGRPAPTTPSS